MKHVHIYLDRRPRRKGRDATKSLSAMTPALLIRLWKDPAGDEGLGGEAIQELVRRGLDPRTGKNVGVAKAREIAKQIGDFAGS